MAELVDANWTQFMQVRILIAVFRDCFSEVVIRELLQPISGDSCPANPNPIQGV